jgi:hypothetical protein
MGSKSWGVWGLLSLVGCAGAARGAVPGAAPPEQKDAHSAAEFPGLSGLTDDQVGVHSLEAPFETSIHTSIVREGSLPSACVELLARAQWRQDVVLSTWAPAHFDNCRFDDSAQYIAALLGDAEAAVARRDRDTMMVDLGRALHAVQDFYAHTNYVELMAHDIPSFADVPVVDVWHAGARDRLHALAAKGLVSGEVWWEAGSVCAPPLRTHAELNKDSPKSAEGGKLAAPWDMTGFRAAHELALRATHEYLHEFLSRPAWKGLLGDCAGTLGFGADGDGRAGLDQGPP